MIVNLEYHDGTEKIIPLAETVSVKEYHIVIFQEDGKTELEVRSRVDKIRIVGV